MNKKLLPLALVFVSMSGMAAEMSVTKTGTPGPLSRISGKQTTVHRVGVTDAPATVRRNGAIVGVSWSLASYPQSVGEQVEICMNRLGAQEDCRFITPGTRGTTHEFDHPVLGYATFITIKHSQKSGPPLSHPVGVDAVTFHIKY
ncbi:hypothetical protein [Pseudomonas sp. SLFW]|uniref:hypothetical protein n=1 Tax=Pseudomonas sp. SLFW TaxID=2683259 RepID=UPI001412F9A4|nr:hypothetical protein [Pseudomonas sp. SLFW]NBB12522.1 hypothetical protein [Pseudomonas sp. SLFW]